MKLRLCTIGLLALLPFTGAADSITATYDRDAFRQLMRQKLAHMQKVHETVLTDNFADLTTSLAALRDVANSATWKMIRTEGYYERSSLFQTAIADLTDAANRHDSQAILPNYLRLTMACVECHNHVRARISD